MISAKEAKNLFDESGAEECNRKIKEHFGVKQ